MTAKKDEYMKDNIIYVHIFMYIYISIRNRLTINYIVQQNIIYYKATN